MTPARPTVPARPSARTPDLLADRAEALRILRALVRGHDVDREAAVFRVPGQPAAKERARKDSRGGGRFYTPDTTSMAEGHVALLWRAAVRDVPEGMLVGNVALAAIFFVGDARAKDGDNLLKLLLDAGNKGEVWPDDCHCTAHAAVLELDRERPRTVVAFCPTESTLVRAAPRCGTCQAPLSRMSKGWCRRCGTCSRRKR